MARAVSAAQVGSGTYPFTNPIRYDTPLENGDKAKGHRFGSNVVVVNPEDFITSQYLKASGVLATVGATSGLAPLLDPLQRRRISIRNLGPGVLFVGHDMSLHPSNGIPLYPHYINGDVLELPLTYGVQIYVHPSGSDSAIRWFES